MCVASAFPCSEIKDRGHLDIWSSAMYIPKPMQEFSSKSVITGWNFYTRRAGKIVFMVFTPENESNTRFSVRGKTETFASAPGEHTVLLNKDEYIKARSGDVIGFYFPGNSMIPFDRQSGCSMPTWSAYIDNPTSVHTDLKTENSFTKKQAGWHPCRLYAFRAITKDGEPCV